MTGQPGDELTALRHRRKRRVLVAAAATLLVGGGAVASLVETSEPEQPARQPVAERGLDATSDQQGVIHTADGDTLTLPSKPTVLFS